MPVSIACKNAAAPYVVRPATTHRARRIAAVRHRTTPAITTPAQRSAATELRKLLAAYREAKDLIEIGAYVPGTNPLVDRAVSLRDHIDAFLQQGKQDIAVSAESWEYLFALTGVAQETNT